MPVFVIAFRVDGRVDRIEMLEHVRGVIRHVVQFFGARFVGKRFVAVRALIIGDGAVFGAGGGHGGIEFHAVPRRIHDRIGKCYLRLAGFVRIILFTVRIIGGMPFFRTGRRLHFDVRKFLVAAACRKQHQCRRTDNCKQYSSERFSHVFSSVT